jgi:uncharacterized GH25 family protein
VADADVTFGTETEKTGTAGTVSFVVPDPGVDSAVYKITAQKTGYDTVTEDITVIKKYTITIITPSEKPETEKKFTVTIIAKGQPLAGATVEFEGQTKMSGGDGKVSFTAPKTKGDYTMTAEYGNYADGTAIIKVVKASPGFELLTLIVAIGVAFLLLRRRKNK